MIYIYPIGGIGNMFFHIASIWSLAKDNNDDLTLLNIEEKIANLKSDARIDLRHADFYRFLFNRFPIANGGAVNSFEHTFTYSPIPYMPGYKYIGYFQCEKYFKHRRDDIIELFKPDPSFIESINKYSDLFGNISLHVRRNDYVRLYPQIHPPQPMEYYNKALEMLPSDMKVVIFSDDIPWCRDHFVGDRFSFIEEIDYISIYIMTKMKHHIIANSSFSWWGAWMSQFEDKMVITPQTWFGSNAYDYSDIVPENWIKI